MKIRRIKTLMGSKPGVPGIFIDKFAIYDDAGNCVDCKPVEVDANGHEYYRVADPNGKFGLFMYNIKNAIECIRKGDGDALATNGITSFFVGPSMVRVFKYIDREYGETIRQKTIEGWKDAKFGYGIRFSWMDSMGSYLICKDGTTYGCGNTKDSILSFNTEKESLDYIAEKKEIADNYTKEYHSIKGKDNEEELYKAFFAKVKSDGYETWSLVFLMIQEEPTNDKDSKKYRVEPTQVVL